MPSVTLYQKAPEPSTEPRMVAPPQDKRPREAGQRFAPMQMLKHTGTRPVAFNGQIVGTVCGVDRVLPYWYEINVYCTVLGDYVSDIRLFGKSEDAVDLFRVAEHPDIDALYDYLEKYDPCCDLPPVRHDAGGSVSSAGLSLRAIETQSAMRRISDHYRATVGALLNVLPC